MKIKIMGVMLFVVLGCCAFDGDGCDSSPTSDQTQKNSQEQLSQQGNAQVGMPGITNFTEKKIMRRLYEMRDKNIATFTYMVDMQGRLHHVCDSMGYGLPYGVQRIGCLRTYYTRHGAGPFPTEDNSLDLPEPHNGNDGFQGKFRVGHFDWDMARKALEIVGGVDSIALSHLDYLPRLRWKEKDFVSAVESVLDTPIGMMGRGPTAAHRTINLEVAV